MSKKEEQYVEYIKITRKIKDKILELEKKQHNTHMPHSYNNEIKMLKKLLE